MLCMFNTNSEKAPINSFMWYLPYTAIEIFSLFISEIEKFSSHSAGFMGIFAYTKCLSLIFLFLYQAYTDFMDMNANCNFIKYLFNFH